MFRLYLDCSIEIITSLSCHPPNHKIPRDHFIRTGRHRGGARRGAVNTIAEGEARPAPASAGSGVITETDT